MGGRKSALEKMAINDLETDMKIVVTGAAGFIGKKLVNLLTANGHEVIGIDICEKPDAIKGNVEWITGSLEKASDYRELLQDADVCFHLAWAGNSGDGRGSFELQLNNINMSVKWLNFLKEINCKRFVGVGTLAEYDIEAYIPKDGATPNITAEYAIAKMSAFYFTKTECNRLGIGHVWCRLSNTYGEGNTTGNFINFASKVMLSGQRAAFTEAKQMYDFMYVDDTVKALMMAGISGKSNCSYYLGSGKPRELKQYIYILRDTIDPNIELHLGEVPFNGVSLPKEAFDTSKLYEDTGFVPDVEFEAGIKKTIDWMKEQR